MFSGWYGFNLKKMQVFNDGIVSESMITCLRSILAESNGKNPADVCQKMKEICPALRQVSFSYKPNKSISCVLETALPLLVINTHFVLTEHKKIVTSDVYNAFILQDIPHIKTLHFDEDRTDIFIHEFFSFFSDLTQNVHDNFMICIHDAYHIALTDKKDPDWTLIVSAKNAVHDKILKYYFYIKALHQHEPGKKYIDIRFSDMMVLGHYDAQK